MWDSLFDPENQKSIREKRDFYFLTPSCLPIEPLEELEQNFLKISLNFDQNWSQIEAFRLFREIEKSSKTPSLCSSQRWSRARSRASSVSVISSCGSLSTGLFCAAIWNKSYFSKSTKFTESRKPERWNSKVRKSKVRNSEVEIRKSKARKSKARKSDRSYEKLTFACWAISCACFSPNSSTV